MADTTRILRFDQFTLDPAERRLLRAGEEVALGSRYFDALALLVRHAGELISKDRFMEEVWQGIPVTDEALTQAIRTLRRALQDDAARPRFIETVPRHGYRFVAEVGAHVAAEASQEAHSPSSRIAGATTLGGMMAGIAGGSFYGVFATDGGAGGFVTILLLTIALAVLGSAGIGTGMALASLWKGERNWAIVAGGGAGGALVGGLGSALALFGLQALTGASPLPVTGMFEGFVLGLAAALSILLARTLPLGRASAVLVAALVGALATGLATFLGGRSYALTLLMLERAFPHSRLDMAGVAPLFGEDGFFMVTQLGTAMLEGGVFAASITFTNLMWRRRRSQGEP